MSDLERKFIELETRLKRIVQKVERDLETVTELEAKVDDLLDKTQRLTTEFEIERQTKLRETNNIKFQLSNVTLQVKKLVERWML